MSIGKYAIGIVCSLIIMMFSVSYDSNNNSDITVCAGPKIKSPSKDCVAYYFTGDWAANDHTEQAIIECNVDWHKIGSNVVAYSNKVDTGIGFNWIDDYQLEVFLDPKTEVFDDLVGKSRTSYQKGREVTFYFKAHPPNASKPENLECSGL